MQKLQQLSTANNNNRNQEGENWKEVRTRRRRHRRYVIGDCSEVSIEIVPMQTALHVSRLNPQTKPDDLKRLLIYEFPEVECEEHPSKHPNIHASMKVRITSEKLGKKRFGHMEHLYLVIL